MMERRRTAKGWAARERAAHYAEREAIAVLAAHSRQERLPEQAVILALARTLESYGRYGFADQLRRIARPRPLKASA